MEIDGIIPIENRVKLCWIDPIQSVDSIDQILFAWGCIYVNTMPTKHFSLLWSETINIDTEQINILRQFRQFRQFSLTCR